MREKDIEQQLVKAVKNMGGICPKFVSPGTDGVPDRLIILPGGKLAFAELKAPGEKPRTIQVLRIRQLRQLGCRVFVVDRPEMIPQVLAVMEGSDAR